MENFSKFRVLRKYQRGAFAVRRNESFDPLLKRNGGNERVRVIMIGVGLDRRYMNIDRSHMTAKSMRYGCSSGLI